MYLNHEIKTTYSLKKLSEILFENKIELKKDNMNNNIIIKEIDNQKQLWYFLSKNIKKEIENKEEDINEFNYILNADCLPEFDDITGEFFWNNNDSNWEKVNNQINNNITIKNKVVNIEQGSIINLFKEFINKDKKENIKEISENENNIQRKKMLKYIEELSNILDTK